MMGIGILIGLAGTAIGLVTGMIGAFVGIIAGLIGCVLGWPFHLLPIVLIGVGIIWLVKESSRTNIPAQSSRRADAAPTQEPRRP